MDSAKNSGPVSDKSVERGSHITGKELAKNLTIRHYFAAMAMQGIKSNSIPGSHHTLAQTVLEAVELADALIKELNKESE